MAHLPAESVGECTCEGEFGDFRSRGEATFLEDKVSLPTGSDKRGCAVPDGCLGHGAAKLIDCLRRADLN